MRKIQTYKYFYYLSILHILILIISGSDILFKYGLNIDIRLYSKLSCRLHMYLTSFLNHMNSLMLNFIILDKIFAFFFNNKRIVCKSMIISSTVIAILNIHFLLFLDLNLIRVTEINSNETLNNFDFISNDQTEIELMRYAIRKNKIMLESEGNNTVDTNYSKYHHHYICHPLNGTQYNDFLKFVWNWFDSILYSFLPLIIIIISSLLVFFKYKDIKNKINQDKNLFILLILLSIYFMFTSLSYSLVTDIKLKKERTETNWILLFMRIVSNSNSSIYFVFYLIFLEKYRKIMLNFVQESLFLISNESESLLTSSNNSQNDISFQENNDGNNFSINSIIVETQL
jgi:hypothetical protein